MPTRNFERLTSAWTLPAAKQTAYRFQWTLVFLAALVACESLAGSLATSLHALAGVLVCALGVLGARRRRRDQLWCYAFLTVVGVVLSLWSGVAHVHARHRAECDDAAAVGAPLPLEHVVTTTALPNSDVVPERADALPLVPPAKSDALPLVKPPARADGDVAVAKSKPGVITTFTTRVKRALVPASFVVIGDNVAPKLPPPRPPRPPRAHDAGSETDVAPPERPGPPPALVVFVVALALFFEGLTLFLKGYTIVLAQRLLKYAQREDHLARTAAAAVARAPTKQAFVAVNFTPIAVTPNNVTPGGPSQPRDEPTVHLPRLTTV